MRRSRKPIVIASRRSRLARIQAEMVGRALGRLHPNLAIEYRFIESDGDRHSAAMLAQLGGKGLFSRSVEQAVLAGDADLAVHSLKDLPAEDTVGLVLAAIPHRGDVHDCLIARDGAESIQDLKPGAILGTASPRRAAQALRLRPDLRIELIRGNVETRVSKVLHSGQESLYDATLLARAGLLRSKMSEQADKPLSLEHMLPAACQGALAIQCRADDHVTLTRCLPLNDSTTAAAVHTERQVVAALGADCHSPIAVLCQPVNDPPSSENGQAGQTFRLRVRVLSTNGRECAETDQTAPVEQLRHLVKRVVAAVTQQDACQLLAAAHQLSALADPSRAVEGVAVQE